MSGKRKKSDAEKEWSRGRQYANVVCKLTQVCKDPDLLAEIQRSCRVLKQIQLKAWYIANLHVLRCLDNSIELPYLDQTFFLWCCQAARTQDIRDAQPTVNETVRSGCTRAAKRPVDEALRQTILLYRAGRESSKEYVPPSRLLYDNSAILAIAGQMQVNAQNMIVLHFEKRLRMYVRLQLEEGSTAKAPAAAVRRLVNACYRAEGGDFAEDEKLLREWLGFAPYENIIKANLEHFVSKLHEVLKKVESSQQKEPIKKGIRAFWLLPRSSSYTAAHIVINGITLHGICARTFFSNIDRRNPLDIPLALKGGLVSMPLVCKKELYLRRAFAVSQFETMIPGTTISKLDFDEMSHESKAPFASRLFANQITTNGYSASVLLSRTTTFEPEFDKANRTKKAKRGKDGDDELDAEWGALPGDYETDMLVAIEDGMRSRWCPFVGESCQQEGVKTGRSPPAPIRQSARSLHQYERVPTSRGYEQGPLLVREPEEVRGGVRRCHQKHPVVQDRRLRDVPGASAELLAAHQFLAHIQRCKGLPQVAIFHEEDED